MNVGSAHCRSSTTRTSGRRRARASSTLRTAQNASSGATGSPAGFEQLGRARGGGLVVGRRLLEQPARAERLDERPPGQPVAVGQAAAGGDGRRAVDRLQHLGDEARLADAGGAEHGEQLARAIGDRLMEGVEQPPPLALAADHRRARPLRLARARRGATASSRKASSAARLPLTVSGATGSASTA